MATCGTKSTLPYWNQLTFQPSMYKLSTWTTPDFDTQSIWTDRSGNGINGNIIGTSIIRVDVDTKGIFGKGLYFNGSAGNYVEITNITTLNIANRPITIEVAVKTSMLNGVILERGGNSYGYSIYVEGGFIKADVRPAGYAISVNSGITTNDKWQYITLTYNNVSMQIYINGILANSISTGTWIQGNPSDTTIIGATYGAPVKNLAPFVGIVLSHKIYVDFKLDAISVMNNYTKDVSYYINNNME